MSVVCIVEPDNQVRAFVAKAFEKVRVQTRDFGNMAEALRFLHVSPVVRAVVTHVGRCGEGTNFGEQIRKIPGYQNVAIWYYTNHTPESFKEATGTSVHDLGGHESFVKKQDDIMDELVRLVVGKPQNLPKTA